MMTIYLIRSLVDRIVLITKLWYFPILLIIYLIHNFPWSWHVMLHEKIQKNLPLVSISKQIWKKIQNWIKRHPTLLISQRSYMWSLIYNLKYAYVSDICIIFMYFILVCKYLCVYWLRYNARESTVGRHSIRNDDLHMSYNKCFTCKLAVQMCWIWKEHVPAGRLIKLWGNIRTYDERFILFLFFYHFTTR